MVNDETNIGGDETNTTPPTDTTTEKIKVVTKKYKCLTRTSFWDVWDVIKLSSDIAERQYGSEYFEETNEKVWTAKEKAEENKK